MYVCLCLCVLDVVLVLFVFEESSKRSSEGPQVLSDVSRVPRSREITRLRCYLRGAHRGLGLRGRIKGVVLGRGGRGSW